MGRVQLIAISALLTGAFLAGCGKKHKRPEPPPACDALGFIGKPVATYDDRLEIKREQNHYKVMDCATREVQEKVRSSSPQNSFILRTKTGLPESQKGYVLAVFNRTTCEYGTYKGHSIKPQPEFTVKAHTSPGTSRMKVEKNQSNTIDYEIRECLERDANDYDKCLKWTAVEQGTVNLFIDYSEPVTITDKIVNDCP